MSGGGKGAGKSLGEDMAEVVVNVWDVNPIRSQIHKQKFIGGAVRQSEKANAQNRIGESVVECPNIGQKQWFNTRQKGTGRYRIRITNKVIKMEKGWIEW